jgi:hypothetical protein
MTWQGNQNQILLILSSAISFSVFVYVSYEHSACLDPPASFFLVIVVFNAVDQYPRDTVIDWSDNIKPGKNRSTISEGLGAVF